MSRPTKTTNARPFPRGASQLLQQLQRLLRQQCSSSFQIGDVVNKLRADHGLRVKQIAVMLGCSRQRLSEMRRTAQAFSPAERSYDVDFHYYTIAARAARRLGVSPYDALREVVDHQLGSSRKATSFLAQKIRNKESRRATQKTSKLLSRGGAVVDRCHQGDFRDVVPLIPDGSIKLVVADPPYGQYSRCAPAGTTPWTVSTHSNCDQASDDDVIALHQDLFRLLPDKIAHGGCLIVFRPGGVHDPAWLVGAAEESGWECRHAAIWAKGRVQLGDGNGAYSTASERLLVFARAGEELVNHDGSGRSDVLQFTPVRPNYIDGQDYHLFQKPAALCRFLVAKHTHPGELVCEPFGGTGAVSTAAVELGRHFVYCETDAENYAMGSERIAEALQSTSKKSG